MKVRSIFVFAFVMLLTAELLAVDPPCTVTAPAGCSGCSGPTSGTYQCTSCTGSTGTQTLNVNTCYKDSDGACAVERTSSGTLRCTPPVTNVTVSAPLGRVSMKVESGLDVVLASGSPSYPSIAANPNGDGWTITPAANSSGSMLDQTFYFSPSPQDFDWYGMTQSPLTAPGQPILNCQSGSGLPGAAGALGVVYQRDTGSTSFFIDLQANDSNQSDTKALIGRLGPFTVGSTPGNLGDCDPTQGVSGPSGVSCTCTGSASSASCTCPTRTFNNLDFTPCGVEAGSGCPAQILSDGDVYCTGVSSTFNIQYPSGKTKDDLVIVWTGLEYSSAASNFDADTSTVTALTAINGNLVPQVIHYSWSSANATYADNFPFTAVLPDTTSSVPGGVSRLTGSNSLGGLTFAAQNDGSLQVTDPGTLRGDYTIYLQFQSGVLEARSSDPSIYNSATPPPNPPVTP